MIPLAKYMYLHLKIITNLRFWKVINNCENSVAMRKSFESLRGATTELGRSKKKFKKPILKIKWIKIKKFKKGLRKFAVKFMKNKYKIK